MSSPSAIRRIEGGPWGKSQRFFDPSIKNDSPGPGAPYRSPTMHDDHHQAPIYKPIFESTKNVGAPNVDLPHPSKVCIVLYDIHIYSHTTCAPPLHFYHRRTINHSLIHSHSIISLYTIPYVFMCV